MPTMEWTLEIVLTVLLAATLVQAIRLERALGVLKRDRASLEALVAGFNVSTNQAESGIQKLRAAADGTGRHIEEQLTKSGSMKDDLIYLTERGDRLADRLERLVRAARPLTEDRGGNRAEAVASPQPGTQAERELLQALRMAR